MIDPQRLDRTELWRGYSTFCILLFVASISWTPMLRAQAQTSSSPSGAATINQAAIPASGGLGAPQRPRIGLALEGGGALGLAHIGVLKWFEEHHVPVDRIAGTSMGCLVGALYATEHTPEEIQNLTEGEIFSTILALQSAYGDLSYRRKQDRFELPQGITLGLKGGIGLRNGLLNDSRLNEFLRSQLNAYNRDDLAYDQLPIPLRCVATDLNSMQAVIFNSGPLPITVRASIAIPGIFPPVPYRGHFLVDGGIMENLPTEVVKEALHADVVLAVHLEAAPLVTSDVNSIVGVLARAYSAGTANNVRQSEMLADVLITAKTAAYGINDYDKARELIQIGYAAAEQNRALLQRYALDQGEWLAYLVDRHSRGRGEHGPLRAIRVEGASHGAQSAVEHALSDLIGKPIESGQISDRLRRFEADGSYHASYETLMSERANPSEPPDKNPSDDEILVHITADKNGPPYLLVGPEVVATSSNPKRSAVDLRYVHQNLGGYGSELRGDVRIGFLTQLEVEYYQPLSPHGYYFQPHLGIIRQPVYIWHQQMRIAEQFQQNAGGGLDLGRTFNTHLQMAAEWRAEVIRWQLVNGTSTSSNGSGIAQTALVHAVYDGTESGLISRGLRVDLSSGALITSPFSSAVAPMLQLHLRQIVALPRSTFFGTSFAVQTRFRRNVSGPLQFTLGGPSELSASSIDEYRGTDTALVHGALIRRVAALPEALGHGGLFGLVAYEGGELWSNTQKAFLRQDATTGFILATPAGGATFGFSVGDAGHRKVFFTLGRLF